MKELCNFYTIRCVNNLLTLTLCAKFESEIAWTFDKYAKKFWNLLQFQSLVAYVYFHGQKKEREREKREREKERERERERAHQIVCKYVYACECVWEREESTTKYSCVVCLRRPITTKTLTTQFFDLRRRAHIINYNASSNLCSKKTRFRISWFKYFSFECV